MFQYHSQQIHSRVVNGKGTTKIQTVKIKNKKGTKEVIIKNTKGKTLRPMNIKNGHLKKLRAKLDSSLWLQQ
jgi:hypothetical protein